METVLKELSTVVGVTGAFVYSEEGTLAAAVMPHHTEDQVQRAVRWAYQMGRALALARLSFSEIDLAFELGYILLVNMRGGVLVVVCARTVNLPVLRVHTHTVARKLSALLSPRPTLPPRRKPETISPPAPTAPAVASLSFADLETEWRRIMREANQAQVTLRVMGELAIWLCSPNARHLLDTPHEPCVDMGGLLTQRDALQRLYETLGYQQVTVTDIPPRAARLVFHHPQRHITSTVHLNTFSMEHSLDLTPFLSRADSPLPVTVLLLLSLQYNQMPPHLLRQVGALVLQHDLSLQDEPGKIHLPFITRLCASDKEWHQTLTTNLQHLMNFALRTIAGNDKTVIIERAARLLAALGSS